MTSKANQIIALGSFLDMGVNRTPTEQQQLSGKV